jgi:hypothetical protein
LTTFITLFASATVVVQCIPVQKTWNQSIPGHCWLAFSKVGITVGCKLLDSSGPSYSTNLTTAWFVVADFCFAILPWFVIWDLNMKRKEKLLVACGLSLGVL